VTYLDWHRWVIVFALASVRMTGAFMICPALGESMISGTARRAAILGFSLLAVPMVLNTMPPGEPNAWMLMAVALKEALIGFVIGFFAAVPFWVAENVGNFIDNQRGATMGEVYSPLSGTQVSSTGIFFTQIVSTMFFISGAVFLVLGAVYTSYSVWPIFGGEPHFTPRTATSILASLDGMLKDTVVISAPVIILMFLATIGLGFVNRTAPQLNVFFLSMPVKSALGIAMLVIYLPFIMDMLMYTEQAQILNPAMELIGMGEAR